MCNHLISNNCEWSNCFTKYKSDLLFSVNQAKLSVRQEDLELELLKNHVHLGVVCCF